MTPDGFLYYRGLLRIAPVLLVSVAALAIFVVHQTRVSELLGAAAIALGALMVVTPREPLPTVCLLVLGAEFVSNISRLPPTDRTVLTPFLAFVLYGIHASAALVGSIGRDAEIELRLLSRYARKSGAVALAGALTALLMEGLASGSRPSWTVIGSLIAGIGVVVALVLPLERRTRRGGAPSEARR